MPAPAFAHATTAGIRRQADQQSQEPRFPGHTASPKETKGRAGKDPRSQGERWDSRLWKLGQGQVAKLESKFVEKQIDLILQGQRVGQPFQADASYLEVRLESLTYDNAT
jgi:hypothetical protein